MADLSAGDCEDMEDDAVEKADALLAYKRALKEFRDYSLAVPQPASANASAVVGDWD